MKKILCAFHPKQAIVNFCKNSECLLPMCPNCVKIHAKDHQRQNTHGQFESIQNVYAQVEQNLQNVLKSLVNTNQDLKQVYEQKQKRRQFVKKRMAQYRIKLMEALQRYVDQIQIQILSKVGGQQSGSQEQFTQINYKMQLISESVQKQLKSMAGEKTLKALINHYSSNMAQFYDDKLDDLEQKIEQLQNKDVLICKDFKLCQIQQIKQKVHELYKSIFVGIVKELSVRSLRSKRRISRVSKVSKTSRVSQFVDGVTTR